MTFIRLFLLLLVGTASVQAAGRPNILFIMSDDHAAHAIGAYGGRLAPLNPTPTLDKLAAEGMVLENTFCNNSVCSPCRASILTGQYSHVNGVRNLGGKVCEENQTLPLEMRKAGYQTAVIGKWHLGIQPLAFDYYKVLKGQGKYHNPEFGLRVSPDADELQVTEEGYCSDLIARSSIDWLKNRNRKQPFMLLTHFKAPHGPWDAHERYDSLYAEIEIPEPDSLFDNKKNGSIATRGYNDELLFNIGTSVGRRHAYRTQLKGIGRDQKASVAAMTDDEAKSASYQYYLKTYLRCVRGVDDNIKRLLDYLESEGELDNTLIIYTSDQGMMLGEHDYVDKRWMYEESMRMPFIVRYPKTIAAGTRSDALINNTDFAPMILDYAGVATPASMQGRSFRSIMETGKEPSDWRQATYYRYWMHMIHHYNPAHFGIRTKEWKLIFFYGADEKKANGNRRTPPGWELYNIKNDPLEMNNLHGNPEYKEIEKKLKEQLKATRTEVKDSDANYPHIQAIVEKHWNGGEEEAIQISNQVVKTPIGVKTKGHKKKKK
ncbi:sulfatase family protein [Pontiella sulfatireligans]|uniref:Arylsulfatase n=1 Tax=Pontiella sulfatireligans TaxID=2750658 RepID=A0A6C2UGU0_9BACT|nr:sulfatase [Pontiella sulfatireligans]SPS74321.1 sulfatase S1_11 [Kiritimatiellales bacterium]VGO19338.1 Arylsulfatase [Pontiella sulfatireligans]